MASDKKIRFPSGVTEYQYRKLRNKILANNDVCHICGGVVDKTLPQYHPMSAEIDHIIPVSKGGDPISHENLRLTHRKCNREKSDKLPSVRIKETELGVEPESWLDW